MPGRGFAAPGSPRGPGRRRERPGAGPERSERPTSGAGGEPAAGLRSRAGAPTGGGFAPRCCSGPGARGGSCSSRTGPPPGWGRLNRVGEGRRSREAGRALGALAVAVICESTARADSVGRFLERRIAGEVPWVGREFTGDSRGRSGDAQQRRCPDVRCNGGNCLICSESWEDRAN